MLRENLRILIFDGNEMDVQLLKDRFSAIYQSPEIVHISDFNDALIQLEEETYDFIVADPCIDGMSPEEVVTELVGAAKDTPLLAYSGNDDAELAFKLVQLGAQDYLIKGLGNELTLKRIVDYSIERKRFSMRMKENEAMLRTFIQYAPAGIVVLDKEMRVLMASDRWKKSHKLPLEEVEGKKITELLPKGARKWRELVSNVLKGELVKCDDDTLEHEDGSIDYLKWEMMPWYDRQGEIAGIIKFSEVITEQKELQLELEASQATLEQKVEERTNELQQAIKLAEEAETAKSEFFTNITHELRTPLHAIINFSNFGMRKIDKVDKQKLVQYFEDIHMSGERLLGLVNDILNLSKYQSYQANLDLREQEILPVIEAVSKEMRSLLKKHKMTLEIDHRATGQRAYFDRNRIMQVLINLIGNSIKFSPDKTVIAIIVDDSKEALARKKGLKGVVLAVSDQGPGIPEDELQTIFDEFVQSSKVQSGKFSKGTGIGLAVCRQIIHGHGGQIWAENNDEVGASVYFTLPLSQRDITESEER